MTVVMSCYEHNAVTRCVKAIPDITVLIAEGPLFQPEAMIESFRQHLRRADVAICNDVSNVFGYRLPIEEIAELCRQEQVPLIVDASQAAGCLPVSIEGWGAEYVAMPGHKGLYGPQGTGILLWRIPSSAPAAALWRNRKPLHRAGDAGRSCRTA